MKKSSTHAICLAAAVALVLPVLASCGGRDDHDLVREEAQRKRPRPVPQDSVPPALSITDLGTPDAQGQASLAGLASDDRKLAQVSWTNDRGGSGEAQLTGDGLSATWLAPTLPLAVGTNLITVVAVDGAGNRAQVQQTLERTQGTGGVYTLTPLGTPRILLPDAAFVARMKTALASGTAPALRFKSFVDAEIGGAKGYAFQPWFAALLTPLTGDARYCQFAVQRTETHVQAEEARIASGQPAAVAGDSYLEVGSTIGGMATVMDWCRAQTTAEQRGRWQAYGNQAVWNVWNHTQARWGGKTFAWTGWSVDNPANNYYYSFLEATMLLGLATHGENPQAQAWLDKFRQEKLGQQLVPTFHRDLVGGGSREGTGYGTALMRLWRLYDWWHRSTGERVADLTPHTAASLPHFMHMVVPTLDRLAPTGDHARESTGLFFDYHRHYLQLLGHLYPARPEAGVARTLMAQSTVPVMQHAFMAYSDFMYDLADVPEQPLARLNTAYWGSGTGQLAMRGDWGRDAAYANFICGPYTESHAHRDQGSFVVHRGQWLAYDANVETGSGIENFETLHNLLRIEQNGAVLQQKYNARCQMAALSHGADHTYARAVLTPMHAGQAAVVKLEREFLFLRPGTFVVMDRVQTTGSGLKHVWTLNLPAAPTVNGAQLSLLRGTQRLDVTRLAPAQAPWLVRDWPTLDAKVRAGVRADVAVDGNASTPMLHVLGTNGSVRSAARSDAPGMLGAQITLADGSSATVRFALEAGGGTLERRSAQGQLLSSAPLATTVASWPVLVP